MTGLLSSLLQLGPSINKGGCHSSERRIKSLCKQDSGVLLLPPLPAKAILLLHQIATARSIFYLENVPSTEGPKSFTYYFGYFLFIPWQMHTCIQCIIIVSPNTSSHLHVLLYFHRLLKSICAPCMHMSVRTSTWIRAIQQQSHSWRKIALPPPVGNCQLTAPQLGIAHHSPSPIHASITTDWSCTGLHGFISSWV